MTNVGRLSERDTGTTCKKSFSYGKALTQSRPADTWSSPHFVLLQTAPILRATESFRLSERRKVMREAVRPESNAAHGRDLVWVRPGPRPSSVLGRLPQGLAVASRRRPDQSTCRAYTPPAPPRPAGAWAYSCTPRALVREQACTEITATDADLSRPGAKRHVLRGK